MVFGDLGDDDMRNLRVLRFSACVLFGVATALPAIAQEPALTLLVVPRIGLFNALQYRASENDPRPRGLRPVETAWKPLSPGDYLAAVKDRSPELDRLFVFGPWDLLTTDPAQLGYRSRRLLVTLNVAGATDCVLRFMDPRGAAMDAYSAPGCRFDQLPPVASNERLAVRLEYKLNGAPQTLVAEVPEDFLIVSLGDSYAAGQGNPDVECRSGGLFWSKACADRALWMDERCHRSAFAATIQAGMKMLRAGGRDPAGHRGAVTIVSLACSGATLANGILGPYEGQLNLTEFRGLNADRGLLAIASGLEEVDTLPDQLTALRAVLDQQRPSNAKRTVDVLTMTVGGNDVGFGAALTDMITRKQAGKTLDEVEAILKEKVRRLQAEELPKLRDRLAALRADGYDFLQTLYAEYPDPTRISADPEVFCADVPADGLLGAIAGALGYRLSVEETALAYRVVVRGLNAIVAAASSDYAWRPVDGLMNNPDLLGRGWCTGSTAKERWFRKADESRSRQGNLNGAMHPTFQMHAFIGDLMHAHIANGLKPRMRAEMRNAGVRNGDVTTVRSPLAFAARDGDAAGAARLFCYGARAEACNAKGEFALNGSAGPGLVRVLHDASARWFVSPVGALVADNLPPELQACRIVKSAGIGMDCDSGAWLAQDDELYVTFKDQGSAGLARIFWSTYARDTATSPSPVPQSVPGPLRLKHEIPPGRHMLLLAAVDKVDNATAPGDPALSIPLRVDRTAPVFTSVAIHGHDFAAAAQPYVVPARSGEMLRIAVTADDPGSGVRSMSVIVAPGTENETRSERDNSWAATKCPPLGRLEVQGRWAYVFHVPVVAAAGTGESPARIGALDCAENAARADLVLLHLPVSMPRAQPADWWKANPAAADKLAPRVKRLAGEAALPPANPDSARWLLASAWLNLAAGTLDPSAATLVRLSVPECTPSAGAGTLFSVMKVTQACVDGALKDDAGAQVGLLEALKPLLSP